MVPPTPWKSKRHVSIVASSSVPGDIFTAQFSAVWPPKAAKIPSGFSRSMTFTTNSSKEKMVASPTRGTECV